MNQHPLSHPAEEGPSLEAPAHDGGGGAALGKPPRERALAYARVEQAGPNHPVVKLLRIVGAAAACWDKGAPIGFDLSGLPDEHLSLLTGVLGTGEVEGGLNDGTVFAETVCPGIWMIRRGDYLTIEVGEVPAAVRTAAAGLPPLVAPDIAALPDGVMNIPPILAELAAHASAWRPGAPARGVNLSLLPFSPVDRMVLESELGLGPVEIHSGGYGYARIQATGRRHIWRTRFFNSQGTPIQDILEVCDIPDGARATQEDILDGGGRLLSILDIYKH